MKRSCILSRQEGWRGATRSRGSSLTGTLTFELTPMAWGSTWAPSSPSFHQTLQFPSPRSRCLFRSLPTPPVGHQSWRLGCSTRWMWLLVPPVGASSSSQVPVCSCSLTPHSSQLSACCFGLQHQPKRQQPHMVSSRNYVGSYPYDISLPYTTTPDNFVSLINSWPIQ